MLPQAPRGRTRYLSEDEIKRLLAARACSKNKHLRSIVTLAINTGMWKSEILGIRWEGIDLDKDLGVNARVTLSDRQNGEPRGVPLNKAAIAALTALEADPTKREGSAFSGETGRTGGRSSSRSKGRSGGQDS